MLVVALVVIGGTVWIVQSQRTSTRTVQLPWLWKVGLEDITNITVTHEGDTVSYGSRGDDWVIEDGNDTPVFMDKWSGMTLILSGPRPDRILSTTVEDPAKYGLDPPATVVNVTDRSGQTVDFQLGDPTPDGENRYIWMSTGGLSTIPNIWGEVVAKLVTQPPYPPPFLSTLDIDRIGAFVITKEGEIASYAIVQDEWLISGTNPVDDERWQELALAFSNPGLQIITKELDDAKMYGLGSPWAVVEIVAHRAEPVRFKLGDTTPDGSGRYVQQVGTTVLSTVDSQWADLLITFIDEPPDLSPAEEPAEPATG